MKSYKTLATALTVAALATTAFAEEAAKTTDASASTNMSATHSSTAAQPGQSTNVTMGSTAQPTGQATSSLNSEEKKFIEEVVQANHAEAQLGQLAQEKAQNPQVKQLAERIVQDHQQASQQVTQLAQQHSIQASTEMKGNHKDLQEKLQKASGDEFDKQYARELIKGHKKTIEKFEKMSNDAKDPQIKSFAQQALPKLREHLQMAQAAAGEKSDSAAAPGTAGFKPTANYQINQPGAAAQPGTSPNATSPAAPDSAGTGSTGSSTGSTGNNM